MINLKTAPPWPHHPPARPPPGHRANSIASPHSVSEPPLADQAPAVAASAIRGQLLNSTLSVFTTPWMGIGVTLLYYNRRIQAEGYDLVLRARDLRSS